MALLMRCGGRYNAVNSLYIRNSFIESISEEKWSK